MIRTATLALVILVVSFGTSARAQQPAPATPPETAPAEAAPAETPIAVPEVIGRATETERELREIAAVAGEPDAAVVAIAAGIPALHKDIDQRATEAGKRIGMVVNIRSLFDVENAWLLEQTGLDASNATLTKRIRVLEQKLDRLDEIETLWRSTRGDLRASGAPGTVLDRIDSMLSVHKETREKVAARRDALLDNQAEIAALLDEVAGVLGAVAEAKQKLQSGLFGTDAAPLWTALMQGRVDALIREREVHGLVQDLEGARDFVAQRLDRIVLQVLFIVVSAGIMLALRRMAARWPDDDPGIRASAAVVSRPYSCAVLIGYVLTPALYPNAPSLVLGALGIVVLVPILRLVPLLLGPATLPTFYALIGFYVVDRGRELIAPLITLERLIFAVELIAAAAVLGRLLRPARLKLITSRRRLLPFTVALLRIVVALLVIAAAANILGITGLSILLGEGALRSVYYVIAAYAVYRVLEGVIGLALRSNAAAKLNMVRQHRPLIVRRTLRVLRTAAAAGWVYFTAGLFGVRSELFAAVRSALSAPLDVGELSVSLGGVLVFGVVFAAAFYFSRLLCFVLEQDVLPRMRLPRGVPFAVTASIRYAIVFLGLIAAFTAAGIDLGKFSVLAGALGVGVGFGLQNVVNNFVSGLILLFERPVQTGDVVEVGALLGEVRRIGIRSSTLRTLDGAEVIVPNANLISDQVVNWTLSDRQRRLEVNVGVKYGTDPERVLALLLQVASDDERILASPAPDALFQGFGDSSLDFTLRAWTADYARWIQVRSDLTVAVNRALADAGIEIPFPQRDLHLRSVSQDAGAALRAGDDDA